MADGDPQQREDNGGNGVVRLECGPPLASNATSRGAGKTHGGDTVAALERAGVALAAPAGTGFKLAGCTSNDCSESSNGEQASEAEVHFLRSGVVGVRLRGVFLDGELLWGPPFYTARRAWTPPPPAASLRTQPILPPCAQFRRIHRTYQSLCHSQVTRRGILATRKLYSTACGSKLDQWKRTERCGRDWAPLLPQGLRGNTTKWPSSMKGQWDISAWI